MCRNVNIAYGVFCLHINDILDIFIIIGTIQFLSVEKMIKRTDGSIKYTLPNHSFLILHTLIVCILFYDQQINFMLFIYLESWNFIGDFHTYFHVSFNAKID